MTYLIRLAIETTIKVDGCDSADEAERDAQRVVIDSLGQRWPAGVAVLSQHVRTVDVTASADARR